MLRAIAILAAGLVLAGCATTKTSGALKDVDVRAAKLVDAPEFDANAMHDAAQDLYEAGDFKKALVGFETVLVRAPEDYDGRHRAMMGYADAALALGPHADAAKKAEDAYQTLAQSTDLPEELEGRLLSGKVLLEIATGESEDAEVRLNEALETNLDDPRLWNALGHLHDKNGDWLIALETYVKALHVANVEGYPVAPVINNMGMSLMMQKRTKEALEKFEHAHELNTDIAIYDNNRRLALILSGRVDKAVKGLTDKRAALIYNDAGYLSASTGRTGRARYLYKKAIELSPTYFEKAELNLVALSKEENESGA